MKNLVNKLNLGDVELSNLETDEAIRSEARRLIPMALEQYGRASGEAMWDGMQKEMRGTAITPENKGKRKFIQDAGKECQRTATESEKKEIEAELIMRLQEFKAEHTGKFVK